MSVYSRGVASPLSERSPTQARSFEIAGWRVEPPSLRVTIDGEETRLEAKVMLVLVYLAEHAGRVVSRSELEEQLWPGRVVTEDSVTKAIAKLRRVFGDDAHDPRVIETVPKSGYRLIAEVTPVIETDEEAAASSRQAASTRRRDRRPRLPWVLGGLAILILVLIATRAFWQRATESPASSQPLSGAPAVAVLPFQNLGEAPEEDYFANGITADLITDLSKAQGLLVIAPGSAISSTNGGARPGRVSAALDVDYVIVGSVQRQETDLRINVQVIVARTERALWGERYSGRVSDLFEIQDRLAAAVIAALNLELAPSAQENLASRPTASVAAYDHYLRGLEDHGTRDEDQNLSARAEFERAITLDPSFARAYAGLALTYARDAIDGWTPAPSRSLSLAAENAAKAVSLDPSIPQAYFATGEIALFQRRHLEAIAAAERAIAVHPNYADAYALLAWTLNYAGRSNKAETALENAMRLNPRPPASYLEILGEIRFAQGRYDESAAAFQRVLAINPGYTRARLWNAAALARVGHQDRAEWEAAELLIGSPDLAIKRLSFAFPFKDARTLDILVDALRKAGVPE